MSPEIVIPFGGADRLETIVADKIKRTSSKPKRDAFKVGSAKVTITRTTDRETLQIDGRVEGFHQTDGGYRLKRDVYQKPAKSLRTAVERYLQSEIAK